MEKEIITGTKSLRRGNRTESISRIASYLLELEFPIIEH
jgi:hypothetical protein